MSAGKEVDGAPRSVVGWTILVLALAMTAFHLVTAVSRPLPNIVQASAHLAFGLALIVLVQPGRGWRGRLFDALVLAAGLLATGRILLSNGEFGIFEIADPSATDLFLAFAISIVVLDAARRTTGWVLPLVAMGFVAYAFLGPYLPGILGYRGTSYENFLSKLYFSSEGIFGVPLEVSSTFIFVLVVFGTIALRLGAGTVFMDLADGLVGSVRGGPAKAAVLISAFFGTMTGSGMANTAAVGPITIGLMRRTGYSANFAGAVEAAASMGGQIMPPVMGAAAFAMMNMLNVSYPTVATAALVPAILYFVSIYVVADCEAARRGLRGLAREDVPSIVGTLAAGWPALLAPMLLFYLIMIAQWSPARAGFWAIMGAVAVDALGTVYRRARLQPWRVVNAFREGAISALSIVAATAAVGIIIAAIDVTGLGLRFSALLIHLSGGNLALLLVLAMLASLIVGTGLPTLPAYIVVAVLTAPALTQLGVPLLAAHLFVFFFAIVADLTPPTAVTPYIAASIAGGDGLRTAMTACRIALPSFVVAFAFVVEPGLLLAGPWSSIVVAIGSGVAATLMMAAGLQGYLLGTLGMGMRLVVVLSGLAVVYPSTAVRLAGAAVLIAVTAWRWSRRRRLPAPLASADATR